MFYGIYDSALAGKTGCVQQFASIETELASFPPMVEWYCPACKTEHNFRFSRSVLANTPRQVNQFISYCEENHIEKDVDVF